MKKNIIFSIMLLIGILLCGCKGTSELSDTTAQSQENVHSSEEIVNSFEEEGSYDVQVEEEKLELHLEEGTFIMGAQYEGEEPFFLVGDTEGKVYSYKPGQDKELLLENMVSTYVSSSVQWWKLGEQYYTVFNRFFNVFKRDGQKAYQVLLEDGDRISDMCMTESGKVAAVWYSAETYKTNLIELNPETGEMTSKLALQECYGISGGGGDGVMIKDRNGIYTYDLQSGEKNWHIKFENTTYDTSLTGNAVIDFRQNTKGEIVSLEQNLVTDEWYEETISKVPFAETGKIILVYQVNSASTTLKEVVAQFNKENEKYFVRLDERDFSIEYDDYVARTNVELATGKGADIIDYYAVDNIDSLVKKGAFENLEPYIEKSNMDREDYFPGTFRDFETGEGCYGLGFCQSIDALYMKEELARGVDSLETLLDSMEAYGEDAVFSKLYQRFPGAVLNYFFEMSVNAHGLLNWEKGTCDFSDKVWKRLLENSLQYGQGDRKQDSEEITMRVMGGTFDMYALEDMEAKKNNMVPIGYPAENGMVQKVWIDTVCMNANSKDKDGVWEFMQYLLSSQSQQILSKMDFPVSKNDFKTLCQKELANPSIITVVDYEPVYVTEEQIETISKVLEEAQLPVQKNEEVLDIILEEAESYFSGEKTIEQVTEIIENRVNMFMAENM